MSRKVLEEAPFIPTICYSCPTEHVENCPDCFGWEHIKLPLA
jgi:hypothetical protein